MCRQGLPALWIEQILKLVEDNEARHSCCIDSVQGIEQGKRLILRRCAGEIGHGFIHSSEQICSKFKKLGVFIDPEQERFAPKRPSPYMALLLSMMEDERCQGGLANAANASEDDSSS